MNRPKILSDIVITCTKDVLKIFDVNNDPQIRDNNLICGNDEGVPILMSLTVCGERNPWIFLMELWRSFCHANIATTFV